MSEKASSDRPPATACIMKALITDIRFLLRTPPLDCRDKRARPLDVNHALRDVAALLLTGKAEVTPKRLRFSPTPTAGQRTRRQTCISRSVRDSFLMDDKFADAFDTAARPSPARQQHPGWGHLRSRAFREQRRQPWTSLAPSAYQRRESSFRSTIAICRFPSARSCYAGRNPSSWLRARGSTTGPASSAPMSSRD